MVEQRGVITKVYFPRLILPVSAVISGLLDFAFGVAVFLGMMPLYRVAPGRAIFLFPAFLLLFDADRQLIWAWAADGLALEPGVLHFHYRFAGLPLRPNPYYWQVSMWDEHGLIDLWDCLPEMTIATEVHQHPRDEWNGVLNVPCEFSIQDSKGQLHD